MLKETLKGKRILFIGVKFYHYHLAIQQKMEAYGASVSFFAERDTTIRYGIVNRIFPRWLNQFQDLYYKSILKKIENQHFDYFLVIRGYKMPLWFVQQVKANNPGITCILYQWDANINSPFLNLEPERNTLPEFDKVLSFDYKDVAENPGIQYCPTFYTDEIKTQGLNRAAGPGRYDFFYFGSYLPERYAGLLKFKAFAQTHGFTLKVHFYMPYRYYWIERLKGVKLDKSLISTRKMNRQEYLQLFRQSRAIVDVSNHRQTGMAMRVIDALGTGKKVLTTNPWVTQEPGYNPRQIAIIDIEHIHLPPSFLQDQVAPTNEDYSIDQWLARIFGTTLTAKPDLSAVNHSLLPSHI